VAKYEPFSIREAINNCVFQFTKITSTNARINVIEMDDQLILQIKKLYTWYCRKVVIEDDPKSTIEIDF
jgi:ATP-dependent DNA helicase RecG